MNQSEFNEVFDAVVERCRSVLNKKSYEYAGDNDRLHNFKIAASIQGETAVKSLGGMYAKHAVSVFDMISRHEKGERFSREKWEEKITDSVNYMILLSACLEEQRDIAEYLEDKPCG
ncbi:MAG TPA: hypothetical protein PKL77_06050 [Candidatus Omnitrophota bacterium]|nr:hypothetical protein [Candidatus Omnitrophota bacterium]